MNKTNTFKILGTTLLCSSLIACQQSTISSIIQQEPAEEHTVTHQTEHIVSEPEPIVLTEVNITIPAYTDSPFTVINDNAPYFLSSDYEMIEDAYYEELDDLGRAVGAYALLSHETMPTTQRESIGMIEPSGWQNVRYDDLIQDKYLYNRCHLIGYQLAGENSNERNLITGTRYMNKDGMLPFENRVANYIEQTENHVFYRVTPVYEGDELVARGVLIEAQSIEDDEISFNVFVHNVQPGITIDYSDGTSYVTETKLIDVEIDAETEIEEFESTEITFVANTNSNKFHKPDCSSVSEMKEKNRWNTTLTAEELIAQGYSPCQNCKPAGETYEEAVQETRTINTEPAQETSLTTYVVNTNTKKFHRSNCSSVSTIKAKNRSDMTIAREELISSGYSPCKRCNP